METPLLENDNNYLNTCNYYFQDNLVKETIEILLRDRKVCLGASPASGKTEMSIKIMEKLLSDTTINNGKVIRYDNKKLSDTTINNALVLTHGQVVLRDQYLNRLIEYKPNFSFGQYDWESASSVKVGLPHLFRGILAREESFDLYVVDEAHEFYHAEMVQSILAMNPDAYVLCLTGTPFKFTHSGEMEVVYFSTEELLDEGAICNPEIKLVQCSYGVDVSSLRSEDFEVVKAKIKKKIPELDLVYMKNLLSEVEGKTMIVCGSVSHSKIINNYLSGEGFKVLESNTEVDPGTENIDKFNDSSEYNVLLVVRRGVLGYSLNSLINIIDYSFSHNPTYIYQLYNRLTRRFGASPKRYYKVTSRNLLAMTYGLLNTVMYLMTSEGYRSRGIWGKHKTPLFPMTEGKEKDFKDYLENEYEFFKVIREFNFKDDYLVEHKSTGYVSYFTSLSELKAKWYGNSYNFSPALIKEKLSSEFYYVSDFLDRTKEDPYYKAMENYIHRNGLRDEVYEGLFPYYHASLNIDLVKRELDKFNLPLEVTKLSSMHSNLKTRGDSRKGLGVIRNWIISRASLKDLFDLEDNGYLSFKSFRKSALKGLENISSSSKRDSIGLESRLSAYASYDDYLQSDNNLLKMCIERGLRCNRMKVDLFKSLFPKELGKYLTLNTLRSNVSNKALVFDHLKPLLQEELKKKSSMKMFRENFPEEYEKLLRTDEEYFSTAMGKYKRALTMKKQDPVLYKVSQDRNSLGSIVDRDIEKEVKRKLDDYKRKIGVRGKFTASRLFEDDMLLYQSCKSLDLI